MSLFEGDFGVEIRAFFTKNPAFGMSLGAGLGDVFPRRMPPLERGSVQGDLGEELSGNQDTSPIFFTKKSPSSEKIFGAGFGGTPGENSPPKESPEREKIWVSLGWMPG